MDAIVGLYGMIIKDKGKSKERFDIILEPMQAMSQIALISFCPKGSKLSISNNLLFIQTPTWIQGLTRSYNNDRRDDLFFLFKCRASRRAPRHMTVPKCLRSTVFLLTLLHIC